MLVLRLLFDYQYAKAVFVEVFNYAPYNDTPVIAQPFPEEVGESSAENVSPVSQGVVSKYNAAVVTGTDEELGIPDLTRGAYSV